MPRPAKSIRPPLARYFVAEVPDLCPDDSDLPFVVTMIPQKGPAKDWPYWREWGIAAFNVRSVADKLAAILNGEEAPAGSPPPEFALEYRAPLPRHAFLSREAYESNLDAARWKLVADLPGEAWCVGFLYDETVARQTLAALTPADLSAARERQRARDQWLDDSDREELAKDPIAQALLETLRTLKKRRRRLDPQRVSDSAHLAARCLRIQEVARG